MDVLRQDLEVNRPMDCFENPCMHRLQADLNGTVQLAKQANGVAINEIGLGFQMIVESGSDLQQHLQKFDTTLRWIVEGGVQDPHLTDITVDKQFQFSFQAVLRQGPNTLLPPGIETVIAGKGTASRDFPQNTRRRWFYDP